VFSLESFPDFLTRSFSYLHKVGVYEAVRFMDAWASIWPGEVGATKQQQQQSNS
jgi:hypothetical protein